MKVLVTGMAGFIGSHLAEELVKRGNKVIGIDDLSTGKGSNLNNLKYNDFVCYVGDICTAPNFFPQKMEEKDFDVVYHLAAKRSVPESFKKPHLFFKDNISGTYNILEKFKGARIVNISSSSAQYCLSPYGISKKTAEQLTALFPNTVSLRLFNVFGERQADCGAIVPEFAKKMLKGIPPTIYGDGRQTRDFTYVKDVVCEIIEYGQGKYKDINDVSEIGYMQQHTVNAVFKKIARLCNFAGKPIYDDPREGDIKCSQAEYRMKNSNYKFEKGLERTVKWIKENPYGGK